MQYYIYLESSGYEGNILEAIKKQKQTNNSIILLQEDCSTTPPAVGIVHETAFDLDANKKQLVTLLAKCKLVIFFTENYSRPEIHNSAPVKGPVCWKSHPKYIVKFFDRLISMLENEDSKNWDVNKWVPPWPEHLVAARLLQLAVKNEKVNRDDLGINNKFWKEALKEFNVQKEHLNNVTIPDKLDFDKGCEELNQLLSAIAEAQAS